MKTMAAAAETAIFYESPYRLQKTLEMMVPIFGENRPVCVSRELTKIHEENFRGTLAEAVAHFASKPVKGEIVVVVGTADAAEKQEEEPIFE